MEITKRDVVQVLSQSQRQEQHDKLEFLRIVDTYGADRVLTWWRNVVRDLSPGLIGDPRR